MAPKLVKIDHNPFETERAKSSSEIGRRLNDAIAEMVEDELAESRQKPLIAAVARLEEICERQTAAVTSSLDKINAAVGAIPAPHDRTEDGLGERIGELTHVVERGDKAIAEALAGLHRGVDRRQPATVDFQPVIDAIERMEMAMRAPERAAAPQDFKGIAAIADRMEKLCVQITAPRKATRRVKMARDPHGILVAVVEELQPDGKTAR
jgi:hypothetical protein